MDNARTPSSVAGHAASRVISQAALGGVAMPSSAVTASTTTAMITSARTNRRSSHSDPLSASSLRLRN
jgi:hypothetical protein